jgi:hypothetical protein
MEKSNDSNWWWFCGNRETETSGAKQAPRAKKTGKSNPAGNPWPGASEREGVRTREEAREGRSGAREEGKQNEVAGNPRPGTSE